MATSIGPDVIVLDRRVPDRLVRLLKAHPVSSTARIHWRPRARSTEPERRFGPASSASNDGPAEGCAVHACYCCAP
jgi:hypothetical protein